MRVYLDDERRTPDGWIRTFNVADTISLLDTGKVEEISLDHDLGSDTENGYDVLLWIEYAVVMRNFNPPIMNVHSANPPAAKRMWQAIESINRRANA